MFFLAAIAATTTTTTTIARVCLSAVSCSADFSQTSHSDIGHSFSVVNSRPSLPVNISITAINICRCPGVGSNNKPPKHTSSPTSILSLLYQTRNWVTETVLAESQTPKGATHHHSHLLSVSLTIVLTASGHLLSIVPLSFSLPTYYPLFVATLLTTTALNNVL